MPCLFPPVFHRFLKQRVRVSREDDKQEIRLLASHEGYHPRVFLSKQRVATKPYPPSTAYHVLLVLYEEALANILLDSYVRRTIALDKRIRAL